ncbi:MAG: hypothetical protein ABSD92_09880 [Candidatus Bathyarchaeia archaeon]
MKKIQIVVLVFFILLSFSMIVSSIPVKSQTATIWTDNQVYPHQSIVTIYGAGFNLNTAVNLTVKDPNSVVCAWVVQSNSTGGFTTTYQLGNLDGNYTAKATDGVNTAVTIFTDPATFGITSTGSTNYPSTSIGDSNIESGTGSRSADWIEAWDSFTTTQQYTIYSFVMYQGASSGGMGNMHVGLYTDSSGPSSLVSGSDSGSIAVSSSTGWVTYSYSTPFLLPAGTYWIAFTFDTAHPNWNAKASTGTQYYDNLGSYASLPSSWPSSGSSHDTNGPVSMYFTGAQIEGYAQATKATLSDNNAQINSMNFYASAAGSFRLAIYSDSSGPSSKLWESASTTATVGWNTVNIASGTPTSLTLQSGTYWLVWQWNSATPGPSYTVGSSGTGNYIAQTYGTFPSSWSGGTSSSEEWSIYASYSVGADPAIDTSATSDSGAAGAATATISLTTTKPDLLYFSIASSTGQYPITGVTDSLSTHLNWAQRTYMDTGSGGAFLATYYALWSSYGPITITVSWGGATSHWSMVAFGIYGENSASPFDAGPITSSGTSTSASVSLTTLHSNDFVIGALGAIDSGSLTMTAENGFSIVKTGSDSNGYRVTSDEYQAVTSPGAVTPTYSLSTSEGWAMIADSVEPAGPSISLSPSVGTVGTSVTVSGSGFAVSSALSAKWDSSALTLSPASPQTTSGGAVPSGVTFAVPSGATAGPHTVTITDGLSDSATATFTVTLPNINVDSISISAPSSSAGGTVSTSESFTISASIRLDTGSASVSATLTNPSGTPAYTITSTNPVVQTVGTSDVVFSWTVTAPSSARAAAAFTLSATATGYNTGSGSLSVTTVAAALLSSSSSISVSPASVNIGGTITVTMTVHNSGTASANAVAPSSLTLGGTGSATYVSGPSPASATISGSGGSQNFVWTYTAATAGTVTFQGSASGTDQYSGSVVSTGALTPASTTVNPPVISVGSVAINSPSGSAGGTVSTGETFVVDAKVSISYGSTSVSSTLTLPSGYSFTGGSTATESATVGTSNVDFTWTVLAPSSASASTPFPISAKATGYTAGSSNSLSVTTVAAASLVSGSSISASGPVNVGGTITVTMTVHNSGSAAANTVVPSSLTLSGTGSATLASGPTPTSISSIDSGASPTFIWTYTATSAGSLTFSGSASGSDAYSGSGVATGTLTSSAVTVNPPLITVDSVVISLPSGSAGGGIVSTGETFVIDAKVKVGYSSTSVSATLTLPSGYSFTGGSTASESATVGTSDVDFTWTVTAPSSASSTQTFSVSAIATGYQTGTSNSLGVATATVASLTGSLSATTTVSMGGTITVTMTVTNGGTASAISVVPSSLTLSGTGSATVASGPTPTSATITGGSYKIFTWTYTASSVGSVQFSGSASGSDQYSGSSVLTGSLIPATTTVTAVPFGLDTSGTGAVNNSTATVQVSLSNCVANDVIIVLGSGQSSSNTVTGVTDNLGTHLSWALRVRNENTGQERISEWWAPFTAGGSIIITVTFSSGDSSNGLSAVAFAISGANTTSPFDTNSGLPYHATGSSSVPSVTGVSTTNKNDMIIGLQGSRAATTETAETGYTLINSVTSTAGSGAAEDQVVTSALSSATVSFGTSTTSWAMIVDAVKQAYSVSIAPSSVTMDAGQSQAFTATVSGGNTETYQWYLDSSAVSGATSSSYSYTAATGSHSVYVKVTDSVNGPITSNTASVNVNAAPTVTVLPTSWSMDMGQQKTFSATASGGSGSYSSYQWYVDSILQGGTGSSFTYSPGSSGSHSITVKVTSGTMDMGQQKTFIATASGGSGSYSSYQWYVDSILQGGTGSSFTYSPGSSGSHSITVKVTFRCDFGSVFCCNGYRECFADS